MISLGQARRRSAAAVAVLLAGFGAAVSVASSSVSASTPLLTRSGPIVGAANHNFYADGTTGEHFSSPAFGDFFNNGQTEAVAGYPDGTVHLYSLSSAGLGHEISVFNLGHGAIQASPVVVDLNGDGWRDVLVANLSNRVVAFTPGLHNKVIFSVTTGPAVGHADGDFATPAVADINRDGYLDVIEASWSQYLYVWSGKASADGIHHSLPGFPKHFQDTMWSSPAVADVDGDGWKEIVFGYDCDGAKGQRCYPNYGGFVTVVRHDGSIEPGWPRFVEHQVVWSSPAIQDLDGDGHLDIVVGTGNMNRTFDGRPMDGGKYVYAFRGDNGRWLPGWPVHLSATSTSSPAIGNIAGNGRSQVAILTEDGVLYVMDSRGHGIIDKTCVNNALTGCAKLAFHGSVSLADLNGDGRQEIIVGGEQWLDVYTLSGSTLVLLYRGWPADANHGSVTPHLFTAAPTIVTVGNRSMILLSTDTTVSGGTAPAMYAFLTPHIATSWDWPTFKRYRFRLSAY